MVRRLLHLQLVTYLIAGPAVVAGYLALELLHTRRHRVPAGTGSALVLLP